MASITFDEASGRLFVPYLHRRDGVWIDAVPRPEQQVFTFQHRDTGKLYSWHVAELLRLALRFPERVGHITVDLLPEQVDHVRRLNGVEPARLLQLTTKQLEVPGLFLKMPGGSDLLVDGNHRYVRRFDLGLPSMRFVQLHEPMWRLGLLNVPADIARSMLGC